MRINKPNNAAKYLLYGILLTNIATCIFTYFLLYSKQAFPELNESNVVWLVYFHHVRSLLNLYGLGSTITITLCAILLLIKRILNN